ncbi:hypothetical protein [Paenibacillus hunanensis]|uniref:Tail fiber protein n=1 Tax=Paenibacillus hunanensis TaxID=539262 RepID=A0ABU1IVR8_9BACL|nr:hypothetical protein [Paenibacillus hunanensis]MDR6243354.1 hypothetical protein [Paenibacillus hunanensis]GGI97116.1 hypothetical protein GCM10008022_02190 [Paenibacillus hunanensis]
MSSNTEKLNLLKVDPVADGEQYFNVDTMLNANWDKVDAFADQMSDKVDGDLLPRLNTAQTNTITFKPGTQTITVARDMPVNVTTLQGKMLLNLTGRSGGFEQLPGFFLNASGTLDTVNKVSGNSGLKVTITNNGTGIAGVPIYNPKLGANGAKYLIRGVIKNGNLSGDGAYIQITDTVAYAANNLPLIKTSEKFVNCFALYDGTKSNNNTISAYMALKGQSGEYAYFDEVAVYEISNEEYIRVSSLTADEVASQYPYTEGLAGVKNPYAIRWTNSSKTDIASMLAFDTELLAPPVPTSDVERDRLEQGADGQYYKTSVWNKIVLDGSLPWAFAQSWTGYKAVTWQDVPAPVSNTGYITKYNKVVLSRWLAGSGATSADSHVLDGTTSDLWITVSAADSGWGDNYTPTNDEIKAYFYGWKMYDASISTDGSNIYNRTDGTNKAWCRRTNGFSSDNGYADGSFTLPNTLAFKFSPYELMYKRLSAVIEPTPSEGVLSFGAGENIIELGSGLVLREPVKPYRDNLWNINNGSPSYESSLTKFKIDRFIGVYKNGYLDKWIFYPNNVTKAGALAQKSALDYDPTGAYTASYIRLDKFPVSVIQSSIPINELAILNDLIRDVQQATRRVSAVELEKAEKTQISSPWIVPTLLNGWTAISGYRTGYRKIGNSNIVQMSGVLTNGVTTVGTVLFYLPQGYRPASSFVFTANSRNNSGSYNSITLDVRDSGAVLISFGTPYTGALTFEVTFEAEQ